ncbi:MAG: hypothetical protein ACOZFS_13965 [Thermodesulfobacteriota bacterium]
MTPFLGDCRLCLKPDIELQESHIIPKWAFKRLRAEVSTNNPYPVVVKDGQAVQTSKQITENMLCVSCEQMIGSSENYVAKLAYGTDGEPIPLTMLGISTSATDKGIGSEYTSVANLDTIKITYFASSLVWRASVAHRHYTGKPRIGQRYQEELRTYLCGFSSFPKNARMIMGILVQPPDAPHPRHNIISFPATGRYGGYHRHAFFICGLYFELCIGSQMPKYLDSICLHYGTEKIALLFQPQEFGLIRNIEEIARSARVRGKLKVR